MTLSASTPDPRRRRLLRGVVTALVLVFAGLGVPVGPALGQFATITFPDTAVQLVIDQRGQLLQRQPRPHRPSR